jgi:hypothetical protein
MSTAIANAGAGGGDSSRTLFRAAWLAVVLGIAMEIVVLAVSAGFGVLKLATPVLADLTQKVSWSVFVCVGVAFGTALAKGRAAVAGWIGFLSGPLAFQGARVLHKAVSQTLALPPAAGGPSPLWIALLKGVEYGALGALLAWVGRSEKRSSSDYVFSGLLTGILGGGAIAILFLSKIPSPIPAVAVVSRCANEVLHPVGCALVVYAAESFVPKAR